MIYRPPSSTILQNFSQIAQTMVEICVSKIFQFLAPGGLTPGPKLVESKLGILPFDLRSAIFWLSDVTIEYLKND